jgi:hypothetical protein
MTLQKTALKVIQVAKTKLLNPETGKQFTCKYSDVPKDSNDWVTDLTYLPIEGDMMHLRIEGKWRVLSGWLQGTKWVGLRIRAGDKVIAWKRNIDEIRYILGKRDII